MCGRYVARKLRWADYAAEPHFEEFSDLRITPKFNIAPSQMVPVVRLNKAGERIGDLVKWGLIPSWTKGKPKQQPINARAETVADSAMFRQCFSRRRCLQVADGFYEWRREGETKQPYFIHLATDAPFAFAGLWERWRTDETAEPIDTCCHITTAANREISSIHNRMPVILNENDYAQWLDPSTDADTLQSLLKPLPDGLLESYPVSSEVNHPANDREENLRPLTGEG